MHVVVVILLRGQKEKEISQEHAQTRRKWNSILFIHCTGITKRDAKVLEEDEMTANPLDLPCGVSSTGCDVSREVRQMPHDDGGDDRSQILVLLFYSYFLFRKVIRSAVFVMSS